MSDTTQPAPKAEAADHAAKGAAQPGPAMPIMLGILVVALAAGVALGTLVLGPTLAKAKAKASTVSAEGGEHGKKEGKKEGKEDKAAVYRIENVIVNPSGSEGSHFLMATVAISLGDAKQEETLKAHEDELRDKVISVLEKQTLASLSAPGARDSLRGRIAAALSPIVGSADPARVYLPQFVIQ